MQTLSRQLCHGLTCCNVQDPLIFSFDMIGLLNSSDWFLRQRIVAIQEYLFRTFDFQQLILYLVTLPKQWVWVMHVRCHDNFLGSIIFVL